MQGLLGQSESNFRVGRYASKWHPSHQRIEADLSGVTCQPLAASGSRINSVQAAPYSPAPSSPDPFAPAVRSYSPFTTPPPYTGNARNKWYAGRMGKIALGIGLAVLSQVARVWINDAVSAMIGLLIALILIAWGAIDHFGEEREKGEALSIKVDPIAPAVPLPRKPLVLSFDATDPSCKQQEGVPVIPHHLFRLRVSNHNHDTNHNVRVVLEHASSLPRLHGVELQVRHHQGTSRSLLKNRPERDTSEMF